MCAYLSERYLWSFWFGVLYLDAELQNGIPEMIFWLVIFLPHPEDISSEEFPLYPFVTRTPDLPGMYHWSSPLVSESQSQTIQLTECICLSYDYGCITT